LNVLTIRSRNSPTKWAAPGQSVVPDYSDRKMENSIPTITSWSRAGTKTGWRKPTSRCPSRTGRASRTRTPSTWATGVRSIRRRVRIGGWTRSARPTRRWPWKRRRRPPDITSGPRSNLRQRRRLALQRFLYLFYHLFFCCWILVSWQAFISSLIMKLDLITNHPQTPPSHLQNNYFIINLWLVFFNLLSSIHLGFLVISITDLEGRRRYRVAP